MSMKQNQKKKIYKVQCKCCKKIEENYTTTAEKALLHFKIKGWRADKCKECNNG